MLKVDFPIYFDLTEISIRHRSWNVSFTNITNINQSEAGTDDVEYVRFGKRQIQAGFRCTDGWARIFAEFSKQESITVKYYDIETQNYIESEMYMTGFRCSELYKSNELAITNGIYDITFNLVEF